MSRAVANEKETSSELFRGVRVVLCRPQIAGNVGAIARAMLNFGPQRLFLVNPKADHLCREARRRARAAEFILDRAGVVDALPEALDGCSLVVGTTARARTTDRVPVRPSQAAAECVAAIGDGREVAIVFGHETAGMSNLELDRCNVIATVPTCGDLPSLNLSMAATVLLHELHQAVADALAGGAWPPPERTEKSPDAPARAEDLEAMYGQMRDALLVGAFLNDQNPDITMRYLRRFFSHSGISEFELRLWRAIWKRLYDRMATPKPWIWSPKQRETIERIQRERAADAPPDDSNE